jgi:DNA-binding GntR family transcriptional regulator
MDSHTFSKFSTHKPIRDEVFSSLRDAILDGHFEPGERLVEKDLAQQMDISRTPIREALRKLELEGLVAYTPRKGVVVVGVSSHDALEIYTICGVLEGLAARLAASNRSDEDLAGLKNILTEMEKCIKKNKLDKFIPLHINFHNSCARASKSPRLCQMIISLREYVENFTEISYGLPGRLQYGCEEHREIVEAIDKKDHNMAEQAARSHLQQAKESFLKAISSGKVKHEA